MVGMIICMLSRLGPGYPAVILFCLGLPVCFAGCQPRERQAIQELPGHGSSEISSARSSASKADSDTLHPLTPVAPPGLACPEDASSSKATNIFPLAEPPTASTPWRARTNDFADWPKIDLPTEIVLTIPSELEEEEMTGSSPNHPRPSGGPGQWLEGVRRLLPF